MTGSPSERLEDQDIERTAQQPAFGVEHFELPLCRRGKLGRDTGSGKREAGSAAFPYPASLVPLPASRFPLATAQPQQNIRAAAVVSVGCIRPVGTSRRGMFSR